MEAVLWYVLTGTRGGENRVRILKTVEEQPRNANQLAETLDLDYKTVRHHLDVLRTTASSPAATSTRRCLSPQSARSHELPAAISLVNNLREPEHHIAETGHPQSKELAP